MSDLQAEFIRLKRIEANKKRKSRRKKQKARKKPLEPVKSNNLAEFERIRYIISLATNVTIDQMNSKSRKREFVIARQMLMYFTYPFCSSKFIGRNIGNRDHSTAIHGSEAIAMDMSSNKKFKKQVEEMREKIFAKPIVITPSAEMLYNFEILNELRPQL